MQSRWQCEPELSEPRYSVAAVRQATRLAAELERYRSETLSVPEIEALARELEIDPACMRRALEAVEPEVPASHAWAAGGAQLGANRKKRGTEQAAAATIEAPTLGERVRWGLAAAAVGWVFCMTWIGTSPRRIAHASPAIVPAPAVTTLQAATGVPANSLLLNGGFSAGLKQPTELTAEASPRGWQVMNGRVTYLPAAPGARGGSMCLREGGSLRQLFRTQPYASYRVSLDLSGEQGSHASLHRIGVAVVGDSSASAVHFTEAKGQAAPGWTRFSMEFEAREPGTTLEIRVADEVDGGGGAPIIDNVAVVPVVSH